MKIVNRKARFEYTIQETFEAGIVLTGAEVKSIKSGRLKLDDAYVKIINNELWLVNANIPPYQYSDNTNYQPDKSRKLLVHKKELLSLTKKIEGRNMAIIPVSCYNKGPRIKLQIGIGKGKKQWEKRDKIKRHDIDLETARVLRNKDNF